MMNDTMLEIKTFCDWFIQNNDAIIQSVNTNNQELAIKYQETFEIGLNNIFKKFYKGKIKFGYGYDHKINKWTLDLCHLNKRTLVQIVNLIKEELSKQLDDRWIISVMK